MKIEKIEYSKNYNIQGMQWEKIVMGGTLGEGESEMDAIVELRKKCDQSAQQIVNSLYQNNPPTYSQQEREFISQHSEPQLTTEKISHEQEIENTISEIENATTETLHTFQMKAAQSQKTMGAYNKRKKQLNIR